MPDDFDYSAPRERVNLNRPPSVPIITMLLCTACVVITLAYWTTDSMKGSPLYVLGHFGVQPANAIWSGHYYALLTSFFTHLDIPHIVFNMMWLWQLGAIVELTIPRWKYVLFMVGAAFVGSCCELAVSGQTGAGASGVVYAIFGLLWAGRGAFAAWRQVATRQNMNLFIGWGLLCVFLTYTHIMPIGNGAHWGGFLYGLAIGWLGFAPRRRPIWALALVFLGAVCVMALTWLPWSYSWLWYRGNQEFDRKHYAQAISDYERSIKLGGDTSSLMKNISAAWHNIGVEALQRGDVTAAQEASQHEEQAEEQAGSAQKPDDAQSESTGSDQDSQKKLVDPRASGQK